MDVSTQEKVVKLLKEARDVLEPEGAWTQRYTATTAAGVPVWEGSQEACSFCSVGAVLKAIREQGAADGDVLPGAVRVNAFGYLEDALCGKVDSINDRKDTTHLDVLMSFDFAILMAQDDLKELKKLESLQEAYTPQYIVI